MLGIFGHSKLAGYGTMMGRYRLAEGLGQYMDRRYML